MVICFANAQSESNIFLFSVPKSGTQSVPNAPYNSYSGDCFVLSFVFL
jgi:hypothetical protein